MASASFWIAFIFGTDVVVILAFHDGTQRALTCLTEIIKRTCKTIVAGLSVRYSFVALTRVRIAFVFRTGIAVILTHQ